MDLKFPALLPDLWFRALEPSEIAYTIAFTMGVPQNRKNESPLELKSIEKLESNSLELNDGGRGYYGLGVQQIDNDYDGASLWFEAQASSRERGSYRSGGYMEPDEYPEIVLEDIELEELMVNSGIEEKQLDTEEDFGNYPDFTYQNFKDLLYSYVEDTTSYDDSEVEYTKAPSFPPSIIKKITDFVNTQAFIDSILKNLEHIDKDELAKAIDTYKLDMKQYRGRIAGMKFGL